MFTRIWNNQMKEYRYISRPGILLAILVSVATLSGAQAQAGDFAACADILNDQGRLACYDRAARTKPVAAANPSGSAKSQPMTASPATTGTASPTESGSAPAVATSSPPVTSLLGTAWALSPDSARYGINLYRPNYLLFARYSDNPNEHPFTPIFPPGELEFDQVEARFQLSFKFRLWATDDRRFGVWAAYTQQNQWQVYNKAMSSPFRETNYEPEAMLTYNPDLALGAGFHWRLFNLGVNHQSNGRTDALSRSWNRVIATFGVETDNFVLLVRPWFRIGEEEAEDDNPDIEDYLGYGDITGIYKWHGHSFTLMGRGNPSTGKGAAQIAWTTPPLLGPLRGYVQAFTGYGDSMIDYNWSQNAIGIGVSLNDLLDQPIERF
jgi:phospholipase A1